jgi:hypothetical protein
MMWLEMAKKIILAFIVLVSGVMILLTRNVDFDSLSEEQLTDAGYYVYVIPPPYQDELGWSRTISMKSFDWHCIQEMDSRNDHWNSIRVRYSNKDGEVLTIRISPNDALFDENRAKELQINPQLGTLHAAEHYEIDKVQIVKILDPLGNEVVLTSELPLVVIESIVDSFILVGKVGETSPWEKICA